MSMHASTHACAHTHTYAHTHSLVPPACHAERLRWQGGPQGAAFHLQLVGLQPQRLLKVGHGLVHLALVHQGRVLFILLLQHDGPPQLHQGLQSGRHKRDESTRATLSLPSWCSMVGLPEPVGRGRVHHNGTGLAGSNQLPAYHPCAPGCCLAASAGRAQSGHAHAPSAWSA